VLTVLLLLCIGMIVIVVVSAYSPAMLTPSPAATYLLPIVTFLAGIWFILPVLTPVAKAYQDDSSCRQAFIRTVNDLGGACRVADATIVGTRRYWRTTFIGTRYVYEIRLTVAGEAAPQSVEAGDRGAMAIYRQAQTEVPLAAKVQFFRGSIVALQTNSATGNSAGHPVLLLSQFTLIGIVLGVLAAFYAVRLALRARPPSEPQDVL